MTIFTAYLWSKAAADKYCPYHDWEAVRTQGQCQALCEAKSLVECIGIAYSDDIGYENHCYLCANDTLWDTTNGTGFYLRPGIFEVTFP